MPRSNTDRILLISYHHGAGCPTGGFRWNATVEHLRSFGWGVDVITEARAGLQKTAEPAGAGGVEIFPVERPRGPSRLKGALLDTARRLRSSFETSVEPTQRSEQPLDLDAVFVWHAGYRRSLREQLLHGLDFLELGVAELVWSARAVKVARSLARRRRYRAVVVSSPPHLTQTVGARVAHQLRIPYIADYRDPWTLGLGPHRNYLNHLERIVGRFYETRTLRSAHTVIHNTERASAAVARDFDFPAERHAIPNGYDSTEEVGRPDSQCFRVLYTGHLYPFMDVRPVFAACARLRDRHGLDHGSFSIDFVGTPERIDCVPLRALAGAYGLQDVFSQRPRIPRSEALALQQAASVLVAFDWLFPIAVVSKFYEYARMRGTMLLLGNRSGALADAASKLQLRVFGPLEQEQIDGVMEEAFDRWRMGRFDRPMDSQGIFDRRHQSERIREILERL